MKLFNKAFLKQLISIKFIFGVLVLSLFLIIYWQWLAFQQFLITPLSIGKYEHASEYLNQVDTQTQSQNQIQTQIESQNQNQQDLNKDLVIHIKNGDSINGLAKQWHYQGFITNQYYLRLFCNLNPQYKKIKAGEYLISNQDTPISLLKKLTEGKVIQYSFKIIEGMNSFEILKSIKQNQLIENDLNIDSSGLELLVNMVQSELKKHSNNYAQQNLNQLNSGQVDFDPTLEGWLYPDTYHFSKNETASKILKRAITKMLNVLDEEWQNRADNLPYQSSYQALIMASIIEKETGISSERDKIAGVFVRRLQKKMRLATDPTVIYGVGPTFNGDITYKDLRTKTPYNTYLIKGLPPTPISSPGRESIHAALHPAEGETLYFVADGSGGHYFSKTLEEHNQAVKRYLRLNKTNK